MQRCFDFLSWWILSWSIIILKCGHVQYVFVYVIYNIYYLTFCTISIIIYCSYIHESSYIRDYYIKYYNRLSFHLKILYSPRRLTGFGLTDGEVMERMWSFLRGFGSITKEMTPSRRIDALSDCLLHYARLSRSKIGTRLRKRMVRATELHVTSTAAFEGMSKSVPGFWIFCYYLSLYAHISCSCFKVPINIWYCNIINAIWLCRFFPNTYWEMD